MVKPVETPRDVPFDDCAIGSSGVPRPSLADYVAGTGPRGAQPAPSEGASVGYSLVERWFAELTNKQVRRGIHRSVAELETAIRAFIDAHNADPKPFVRTKIADQILASITRFAQPTIDDHPAELMARTTGTGH